MASNQGRQSPGPSHQDDTLQVPSSSIPVLPTQPPAPTLQDSRVFEGVAPEYPPAVASSTPGALTDSNPEFSIHSPLPIATRSSFLSIPVSPQHPVRTYAESPIAGPSNQHGPRHPSLRISSPPPDFIEGGSTAGLIPSSAPPDLPPKTPLTTLPAQVYDPRGDHGLYQLLPSPGISTFPGSPSHPQYQSPHHARPARPRTHYSNRNRINSGVGEGGYNLNTNEGGVRVSQPDPPREKTVQERLQPTLAHAKQQLEEAQFRAKSNGWSLNIAIGAQVILGALTTGIAAATHGHATSIATSILGGLSTLAASYLAKARGSGEPEASVALCKDLEHFTRDCEAFILDKGHVTGGAHDAMIDGYRRRLEEVLGNAGGAVADTVKEQDEKSSV